MLGSSSLDSCPSSRWPLKAIPCCPQHSVARNIEEIYALFFSPNCVETLVKEWPHVCLGFENKKQSCLMLPLNLGGIVAQHDDLDWIEHLSNFGMVAKSTT